MGLSFVTAPNVPLPGGGHIAAHIEEHKLVLTIHGRPGWAKRIPLERDETVAPESVPHLLVWAEAGEDVLILQDSYPSLPGGLSFCQSGEESFLRVLKLHGEGREVLRIKASSCIQSRELDDPGIEWSPAHHRLSLHWLTGVTYAEYEVTEDGQVHLSSNH